MFLIISFPRATRKPEDQQVSVLSSAQASAGEFPFVFFSFFFFFPGVSEQMYLYQIWLGFSDKKKKLLFSFFPLWKVLKNIFQCCRNISEERKKERKGEGRKQQYFLTMSVS